MYDVTMPRLSDSMEEGKIIKWRVAAGQPVHEGDVLAEVESDKAVMELECFHDGRLAEIVHGDGDEVRVGEVIARIAAPSESGGAPAAEKAAPPPAAKKPESAPPAPAKPAAAPVEASVAPVEPSAVPVKPSAVPVKPVVAPAKPSAAPVEAFAAPVEVSAVPVNPAAAPVQPSVPVAAPAEATASPPPPAARPAAEHRVAISPYARKLAEARGVDTARLQGSGEGGRIMARDVETAAGTVTAAPPREKPPQADAGPRPSAAPVASAPSASPSSPRSAADEELPPLEIAEGEADVEDASFRLKTQARRTVAAKHVIPHFYITISVDVTRLLARRAALKEELGASVTHLIMLACLRAIEKHPNVNRSYDRGHVIRWKGVHLGLAIDTDEGLTVAVLRDAQNLPLPEIVSRTSALADRARHGKLTADDRRHATFTISNLGMFDVEHFAPILNPPSAVTLAVASAHDAPVVRDGGLYIGKIMKLTASCDHRMIDGAAAARFLKDLKGLLENPEALVG